MVPLHDALASVLARVSPLDPVDLPVNAAAGSVLAEDVVAPHPVPAFANSAMDGVAVRAADTAPGASLALVGTVAAGDAPTVAVGAGQAMRIMTGAPLPDGADAVVMVERCEFAGAGDGETVVVAEAVPSGNHVRPVGDDVRPGEVVLRSGTLVTPGGVALLRTVGRSHVRVVARPRVGVLSTGDELVEPPAELDRGQIYDSNRAALLALVEESGFVPVDLGRVADDEAAIEKAFADGVRHCDAVLSTGGVSMGDFDFVKSVLDRIAEMEWMQIAIRPAKPFAFGTIEHRGRAVPVLGLPGNPVSSMVSFELLARPALRRMAGHSRLQRPPAVAVADEAFRRRSDGKTHYVRVVVSPDTDGALRARSAGAQGSHHLASMALANGLLVLPDGDGVDAGEQVSVLVLGEPV